MTVTDLTPVFGQVGGGQLPTHVSYSSLSLAMTCFESWRRRYLVGTRGPATHALSVGSGVHAGIAALYDELRANPKASKKKLDEAAKAAAAEELRAIGAEHLDDVDVTTEQLLEVYVSQRPTHITPVATEQQIEVVLPDTDIPLVGYVDVVGEAQLVEVKTSARKVTMPTGAWRLQAMLYQAAFGLPVEWHVLVKQRTPLLITSAALALAYDEANTQKALSLASATLERIQTLYEQRGPEEEWPTEGVLHPWACNLCDARADCTISGYQA